MKTEKIYVAPLVDVANVKLEKGIAASFPDTTADQMDYIFLEEE